MVHSRAARRGNLHGRVAADRAADGRRAGGGGRLFVEHFLGAEADAAGGEQD
ncbi:MAG: hypothetical protein V9H26_00265 [Verrucomicrobiota bacterium]